MRGRKQYQLTPPSAQQQQGRSWVGMRCDVRSQIGMEGGTTARLAFGSWQVGHV